MDKGVISQMDEDPRKLSECKRICDELISGVVLEEINSKFNVNALEIPLILGALCKMLGNLDLLRCRFVSSFWEEESSRVYMKRNLWVEMLSRGRKSGIKSWYANSWFTSEENFQELCTILAHSENPSLVLKNVEVPSSWDRPTEVPGCSNLLEQFGKSVSRLHLTDVDSTSLKTFIGFKDSYCPNLESLMFCTSASPDDPLCDASSFQEIQSLLKLKEFIFISKSNILTFQDLFGLSLIKNSPKLSSLDFLSDSSATMKSLVDILTELPHVTTNLTKLRLMGYVLPLLNDLSQVKFSSKLKTVEFADQFYTAGSPSADIGNRNLSKFLKILGPNLEKFIVDEYSEEWDYPAFKSPYNLPPMLNIKELWLCNYVVDLEDGPQFLRKFPSLKTLWIHSLGNTHQFLERCSQADVIHQNLEEIVFDYVTSDFGDVMNIETAATIQLFHQVFPKLSKVRLGFPETAADASVDEVKEWMEQAFHEIGQMKNTKNLYICFRSEHDADPQINESEEALDLIAAFENLKDLPNLTRVEIVRSNFQFNITELLLKSMIDIPKIKKLDFFGWTLGAEKDKEMKEFFAKHNVRFEIHDYTIDENIELDIDFNDFFNNGDEDDGEPV